MTEERRPPQDIEAESAILGAILIDEALGLSIIQELTPDDFYRTSHQEIFRAMCSLADKGLPTDTIMVRDELRRVGGLEQCGGTDYLVNLSKSVPSLANAPSYISIVKEAAVARQAITSMTKLLGGAYARNCDVRDMLIEIEDSIYMAQRRLDSDKDAESLRDIASSEDEVPKRTMGLGFRALRNHVKGFATRRVSVIGGRPSMGKTSFALQIAARQGIEGTKSRFFSIEMDRDDVGVFARRMRLPGGSNVYIDDRTRLGYADIRAFLRSAENRRNKVDVVYIDYIQLMEPPPHAIRLSRNLQIAEISRELKRIAREHDVHVCCISQLSRQPDQRENPAPQLSDLRDSGSIEQEADLVMLLYRPGYYDSTADPGLGKINIAKNKFGKVGWVSMSWRGGEGYEPDEGPREDWGGSAEGAGEGHSDLSESPGDDLRGVRTGEEAIEEGDLG